MPLLPPLQQSQSHLAELPYLLHYISSGRNHLDIINNSKVIEKNEEAKLFLGSEKYHKVKTYNKDYEKVSLKEKKDLLFNLEKEVEKQSNLIKDVVDVAFSESVGETIIINSNTIRSNILFLFICFFSTGFLYGIGFLINYLPFIYF